uniref:Uncharacterized protein n=1 Tax=Parascaris univalens TaxID=6257 RepID=A0A915AC49_PARUN
MSSEPTGEERTGLLLRRAALIAKRKENKADYKAKQENKRSSKQKKNKCRGNRTEKAKKPNEENIKSFRPKSYNAKSKWLCKSNKGDVKSDKNGKLGRPNEICTTPNKSTYSRRSRCFSNSTASIANLEDCNRLVSVKLYLRHFRPDGEIEEKVFSGETVNVSTILDTLRFLLRNVKLPLMQHTLGRLFLLRDQFRGGRIDEMAYNTYRHMTLEEVQPQNDEHIFMLDLTDTFFDKQAPDLHHARM